MIQKPYCHRTGITDGEDEIRSHGEELMNFGKTTTVRSIVVMGGTVIEVEGGAGLGEWGQATLIYIGKKEGKLMRCLLLCLLGLWRSFNTERERGRVTVLKC